MKVKLPSKKEFVFNNSLVKLDPKEFIYLCLTHSQSATRGLLNQRKANKFLDALDELKGNEIEIDPDVCRFIVEGYNSISFSVALDRTGSFKEYQDFIETLAGGKNA